MTDLSNRLEQLTPEKRELLQQLLARKGASRQPERPPIAPRNANDPRVLSYAQQQLWFLDQLTPGTGAYNVPHAVRVRGNLSVSALQQALNTVCERHEVLRTLYLPIGGKPVPAIAKPRDVALQEVDLTNTLECDREGEALAHIKMEGARPFDLAREIKLRSTLYRLGPDDHIFLHVSHHIAWDLRSRAIFYRELSAVYDDAIHNRTPDLPALPIQYGDYALWQKKHLDGEVLDRLESYWKTQLTGAPHKLELPLDHPRPPLQALCGSKQPITLSEALLERAKECARRNNATLYMVLLGAFYCFLFHITGAEDIVVGSPFAGRILDEVEDVIGMFINTLPLRVTLSKSDSFEDVIRKAKETALGAIAHQDLPFEKIVDAVKPPRDPSRMALFQVNFRLQGASQVKLELSGLECIPMDVVDNHSSKFDLALELPSTDQSVGYFEYSTDLFHPDTVRKMAAEYRQLLELLLVRSSAPIIEHASSK